MIVEISIPCISKSVQLKYDFTFQLKRNKRNAGHMQIVCKDFLLSIGRS